MSFKILVMGLPGAGKTTLAQALAPRLGAVHLNADEIRKHINKDLGFAPADRIEQARRIGWLCDQIAKAGCPVIADFICPTSEARAAFVEGGEAFIVWVDRIKSGRFDDTNRLFAAPDRFDLRILAEGSPVYWCEQVIAALDTLPQYRARRAAAAN
jgi:adenylylsulfate kinase